MMDQLIARFTEQLRESLAIAEKATIRTPVNTINKVYVAGLGGSGIGADFVAAIVRDHAKVPYLVGKGYDIPAYVDKHTLAIASSYSGNTEETLYSFEQMKKSGATIMVVSAGGKLIQAAKDLDLDYIQVPDNWPSPRACLGYSFVQQLAILNKLGFINHDALDSVANAAGMLDRESEDIKAQALKVAKMLHHKLPVIYSTDKFEPIAVRLRQQINENAKALCWHHVIPEMNHNELVGWRDKNEDLAVLYLRSKDDFKRNSIRMDINQDIIKQYTSTIINLYCKGNDYVEQLMYHVHLGDWISWFLSDLRGMDSIEVKAIDYLKGELAKV
jgi:glucose/mannose-6-phosphate isomerase